MPELIIMRHAKSDWSSYESDFNRGLNNRGYKNCQIISHELKKLINIPGKFLVSPAKRAQLTFEEIFFSWFKDNQLSDFLEIEDELYGGSSKKIIESMIRNFSGIETCVVIGHNPILNELLHDISSFNKNLIPNNLVTCGCIKINYKNYFYDQNNFIDGSVSEYIYPKKFT